MTPSVYCLTVLQFTWSHSHANCANSDFECILNLLIHSSKTRCFVFDAGSINQCRKKNPNYWIHSFATLMAHSLQLCLSQNTHWHDMKYNYSTCFWGHRQYTCKKSLHHSLESHGTFLCCENIIIRLNYPFVRYIFVMSTAFSIPPPIMHYAPVG